GVSHRADLRRVDQGAAYRLLRIQRVAAQRLVAVPDVEGRAEGGTPQPGLDRRSGGEAVLDRRLRIRRDGRARGVCGESLERVVSPEETRPVAGAACPG